MDSVRRMPRREQRTLPDGTQDYFTEIGFRDHAENWNTYLLDDGTVMRMKLVVNKVYKAENLSHPNGDPVYWAESQNMLVVSVPEQEDK